jgi:hypothetical protein
MEIKPNLTTGMVSGPASTPPPSTERKTLSPKDFAAFGEAETLNRQLGDEPEVRSGTVARAQELIGQVSWPPPVVIRRIANLLAANMNEIPE